MPVFARTNPRSPANFGMSMLRPESGRCSCKPLLAAEPRSLEGWKGQTLTWMLGTAGADSGRMAEVAGPPMWTASWQYCGRGSQERVKTCREVETAGLENLDPTAAVLSLCPSRKGFRPSSAVASSHLVCTVADLDSKCRHCSCRLFDRGCRLGYSMVV